MMDQSLEQALEFEKEISLFYLEQGQITTNILVQRLFLTLAKQEIDHMMYIGDIAEDLAGGQQPSGMPEPDIEEEIKAFFTKVGTRELSKEAGNIEALEMAIDMEQEGCVMYRECIARSAEPHQKEFFEKLTRQETAHLESLRNLHYYLTKTGDWMQAEESKVWNWMNI